MPPARFELAPLPPEGSALSPELWGLGVEDNRSRSPTLGAADDCGGGDEASADEASTDEASADEASADEASADAGLSLRSATGSA